MHHGHFEVRSATGYACRYLVDDLRRAWIALQLRGKPLATRSASRLVWSHRVPWVLVGGVGGLDNTLKPTGPGCSRLSPTPERR